uniref:Rhodopsin domain-containing protein n=1 Tax=Bionectria ochroleuca TaxID=29856 RepID=A0A0B7JW50_BIOOC
MGKILRWIIIWFVVYGVVNCITPIFCCIPVRKFWDHDAPGYCIEWGYLHYTLSAINIANDFLLLLFPIPILVKLNVSARVRVILVVTLTCGLVYYSPLWQQNVQITDDSTGLQLRLS